MEKHYFAYVEKEAGSACGIQFPDLPNVFSAAGEEKDILPNAVEALQLYAEDAAAMPKASSHTEILARRDVRKALAQGAYLVSVPLVKDDAKMVRANVTFERGLLRIVDLAAKERGLSRSAFLACAARHEMEIAK